MPVLGRVRERYSTIPAALRVDVGFTRLKQLLDYCPVPIPGCIQERRSMVHVLRVDNSLARREQLLDYCLVPIPSRIRKWRSTILAVLQIYIGIIFREELLNYSVMPFPCSPDSGVKP